jgi:hypothetical protein
MMTQQQVLRGQVDPCQLEQHDQQVSILWNSFARKLRSNV